MLVSCDVPLVESAYPLHPIIMAGQFFGLP